MRSAAIQGFLIARCLLDEWEIENIIVDERHRRRGVGSSLVRELLVEASNAEGGSVILEVRESNRPALRLYENIGFKAEGRGRTTISIQPKMPCSYSLSIADL